MGSNCPICFEDFQGKTRASPDACDHIFCLPCLEKWSKLGSYCPVDRKRYKKICNIDTDDVIQVKPGRRKRKRNRTFYDFTTKCELCSNENCPDVMLLCDCCDLGYHLFCLTPPLKAVPAGLWFCPSCVAIEENLKKKKGITKQVEADGLFNFEVPATSHNSSSPSKPSSQDKGTYNLKSDLLNETSKQIIKEKVQFSVFDKFDDIDKGTYNLKSDLLNETSKQIIKEKIQFSVFDKFDDIDTSQQKYTPINSLVSSLFSSELKMKHCSLCKDVVYVKSEKYCKICKLKYFKNSPKSGKHLKSIKVPEPSVDFKGQRGISNSSSSHSLSKAWNSMLKKRSNVQERRQRSLIHQLKKISSFKFETVTSYDLPNSES